MFKELKNLEDRSPNGDYWINTESSSRIYSPFTEGCEDSKIVIVTEDDLSKRNKVFVNTSLKRLIVDTIPLVRLCCFFHKKWGLYLSFDSDFDQWGEVIKAAPILDMEMVYLYQSGWALFLFDTEEELNIEYNRVVGDDGPTESNPYSGEQRVYALTISPDGESMNENT